jgi:hypothetical protein
MRGALLVNLPPPPPATTVSKKRNGRCLAFTALLDPSAQVTVVLYAATGPSQVSPINFHHLL